MRGSWMPIRLALLLFLVPLTLACGDGASSPADGDDSGLDGDRSEIEREEEGDPEEREGEGEAAKEAEEEESESELEEIPLYRTDGGFIRDREGRVVFLRGINVATGDLVKWSESDPEAARKVFEHIAASFNSVRFVINWDLIEPEKDRIQTAYLDQVESHVRLAAEKGLFIFLDMHQDMYGVGFASWAHGAPYWTCDPSNYESFEMHDPWFFNYFSDEVSACFDHFWTTPEIRRHQQEAARAVAERVADLDRVVGFDPHNEPFPGNADFEEFERDLLMPFYEEFAQVVGEALPGRLLFFEPSVTFGMTSTTGFVGPLTVFSGVFAPHYYNSSVELDRDWNGDVEMVREAVDGADAVAREMNVPWVYGEMGGAMETPDLGEYLQTLYGLLDERMAGSLIWIYSKGTSGFGLINSETGDWNAHAASFLRPAPSVVHGTPEKVRWSYPDLTFDFDWSDDGMGESEILIPAWMRAAGFSMTLDDGKAEPEFNSDGRLVVPRGEAGDRSLRLVAAHGLE